MPSRELFVKPEAELPMLGDLGKDNDDSTKEQERDTVRPLAGGNVYAAETVMRAVPSEVLRAARQARQNAAEQPRKNAAATANPPLPAPSHLPNLPNLPSAPIEITSVSGAETSSGRGGTQSPDLDSDDWLDDLIRAAGVPTESGMDSSAEVTAPAADRPASDRNHANHGTGGPSTVIVAPDTPVKVPLEAAVALDTPNATGTSGTSMDVAASVPRRSDTPAVPGTIVFPPDSEDTPAGVPIASPLAPVQVAIEEPLVAPTPAPPAVYPRRLSTWTMVGLWFAGIVILVLFLRLLGH